MFAFTFVKNKHIRKYGRKILDIITFPRKKYREWVFLKKSNKAIEDVQNVLKQEKFFFMFGTLLGIIRDKKLLGRDLDIDVAVLVNGEDDINRVKNILISSGYKQHVQFTVEKIGINQEAFYKNGVNIDVSYVFYQNGEYITYVLYDRNKVLIFKIGESFLTKTIMFNKIPVNIPSNPETVLENVYGINWRIPNKKYIYWENPCAIKTGLIGNTIDM